MRQVERKFRQNFPYETFAVEPGVWTSFRVERYDKQDLAAVETFLIDAAKLYDDLTFEDHGDCLVLKPAEINKRIGIVFLEELYGQTGNPIDYSNAIWMGNGSSDIPAADYVHSKGGLITAVGNADPRYANFIQKRGGYVAKATHTLGVVEILTKFLLQQ